MIDPAAPTPVGNMGQPIPRYDARAKVTGKALYAADVALPDVAYAYLLSSRIAKGRIKSFDLQTARALPGVIDILTHESIAGDIRKVKYSTEGGPASNSVVPLSSAEIAYAGQTIAVVLAEAYEVAQDAAELCGKVGDGVNQAADLISATASIPSLNFIPLTTFGNWF